MKLNAKLIELYFFLNFQFELFITIFADELLISDFLLTALVGVDDNFAFAKLYSPSANAKACTGLRGYP